MPFHVKWIDGKKEPQCAPDPAFPDGRHLDTGERPACRVFLPYPAQRCGIYVVKCLRCGVTLALTTAGRPDDPRSVMVACRIQKGSVH